MPFYAINSDPPREITKEVYDRQQVEKEIASAFIKQALAAGHTISVNDGGDEPCLKECTNHDKILGAMFSVDDERLMIHKDGKCIGWVYFVYGNDGYDAISDYTVNLEEYMTDANAVSDKHQ